MIYVKSGKLSDSLSYVRLFVIDTAKILDISMNIQINPIY